MIQDISRIREELQGYTEVVYPYDFTNSHHIKYITLKGDTESFYPGGMYVSIGSNCIYVKNSYKRWGIPICKYDKDGNTTYKTRLFVLDTAESTGEQISKDSKDSKETKETLGFQQNIIDKMTDKVKTLQQQNDQLIECKQTYEEMLQTNRYTLKQLSIENREKQTQIDKYKQILQSAIGERHTR